VGGFGRAAWGLETSVVLPIYTVGVSSVLGSLASIEITCLQPLVISQTPKGRDVAPSPWKHAAAQVCPSSFPTKFCFEWGTQPSTASIHYLQKEPQAGKKTQHPWWNSNVSPILRNCLPSQSKDAQSSITCQDGAGYHLGFQHPSTMIDRKRDSNSQGHVTAFFCTNPTKNPNPTPLATLASPITVLQIKLTPTTESKNIQEPHTNSTIKSDHVRKVIYCPHQVLVWLHCVPGCWLQKGEHRSGACNRPMLHSSVLSYDLLCIMIPGGDKIKFNDLKPHCCCHGCHLLTPTHQGCLQYDLMSFSRYWSLYFLSANGSGWEDKATLGTGGNSWLLLPGFFCMAIGERSSNSLRKCMVDRSSMPVTSVHPEQHIAMGPSPFKWEKS
jgi:hypothetical protein